MQKELNVRVINATVDVIKFVLTLLLAGLICIPMIPYVNQFVWIVVFCLTWALLSYLSKGIEKTDAKLSIDHEGIGINFYKQSFLTRRSTLFVQWEEIEFYQYSHERHFDRFVLKLQSGKKVVLNFTSFNEEVITFLSDHFFNQVSEKNETSDQIDIQYKPTFFQSKYGRLFFLIFGSLMMLTSIIILLLENKNYFGLILFFIIGFVFVFFRVKIK